MLVVLRNKKYRHVKFYKIKCSMHIFLYTHPYADSLIFFVVVDGSQAEQK